MALSWNEIKKRAAIFSKEWEHEISENAEAKSFWDQFFQIFGISRRRVATFEHKVTKNTRAGGFIDLLWRGQLLVEHKSAGKDLDKAYRQAKDYFPGLKERELPKYIVVCNFQKFRLFDLDNLSKDQEYLEFDLKDLVDNVHHFGFIAGYEKQVYKEQDPVNIKAADLMAVIHDNLKKIGYDGHDLELYLVRLLFCLFADDSTIFEKNIFKDFIEQRTSEDGSDLASRLSEIFYILNTPQDKRLKNLDEQLTAFPYVNGKLFEETLPPAFFDASMRELLLDCCALNWSKISPAIFGSMFQSVMNPNERRSLGAHYTSEKNILKVIKPLFLDELWQEFEAIKTNSKKLKDFHQKLSTLKFLDPACGCGNFLVITYRELRLLELEVLKSIYKDGQTVLDVSQIMKVEVDQMCGIEIEEFPARIAEVAMWLIDHQMNLQISEYFGLYFVRLPLKKSAKIIHANALRVDWETVISKDQLSYMLGNPPFIGKSLQTKEQKEDMNNVFLKVNGANVLDFVTAWYVKAASYIQDTKIKVAFVSTNSISQGEQPGILWSYLFSKFKIKICFAHQTFKWGNEAKGNAAVHVVIIGFAAYDVTPKYIFEYETISSEPHKVDVKNINPYLVVGGEQIILKRRLPICSVPQMNYGSMPNDGGFLLLNEEDKNKLVSNEPLSNKYIRKYLMGEELINSIPRYCLWLLDLLPSDFKSMPLVKKRVEDVQKIRFCSTRAATNKLAKTPTLFGEIRQPNTDFIAIPRISSINRNYIPIDILNSDIIVGESVYTISTRELFVFAIIHSTMHMSWVRLISGRLKSDYRYSNQLVYNNFPWPEFPTEKQKARVEEAAQQVLNIRAEFPDCSLADFYDPLTMPPKLVKAHHELDKAVDLAYRPQAFASEVKRIEYLFELYEKYTANIFGKK